MRDLTRGNPHTPEAGWSLHIGNSGSGGTRTHRTLRSYLFSKQAAFHSHHFQVRHLYRWPSRHRVLRLNAQPRRYGRHGIRTRKTFRSYPLSRRAAHRSHIFPTGTDGIEVISPSVRNAYQPSHGRSLPTEGQGFEPRDRRSGRLLSRQVQ